MQGSVRPYVNLCKCMDSIVHLGAVTLLLISVSAWIFHKPTHMHLWLQEIQAETEVRSRVTAMLASQSLGEEYLSDTKP